MSLPFVKMNGLGNDFAVVQPQATFDPAPHQVRAWAEREHGIGFDQLISISQGGESPLVRFWNSDGDEIGACGNGSRCVGWLLMEASGADHAAFHTTERPIGAARAGEHRVTVDMGAPRLRWDEIPLAEEMDTRGIELEVGPLGAPLLHTPGCVSMGNPHVVFFTNDVESLAVASIGPMIEHHPLFPEGVNVGFCEVQGRDLLRLRVWERGAGLTRACGTGACAALVAAHRRGLIARDATVRMDGGDLRIQWREDDDHVLMTGPVEIEFTGVLPILTGAAALTHPAFAPGKVAVITGAASGIGLAAAKAFAAMGMVPLLVDRDEAALDAALEALSGHLQGGAHASSYRMDVSDGGAFHGLMHAADALQAPIGVLMNNAGVGGGGDALAPRADWDRVLGVNFFGILNGVQSFAPAMIAQGTPSLIINTGSKQGITTPPGDTAYNVSKAAVKALTEGLAHTLRNTPGCQVSAHLLIPGFVWTGMTSRGRGGDRPAGAWTPEETVAFMLERIEAGDFYILCPDNDATPQIDRKRIAWAAGDIIENRPALSRWHPDYADAFAAHMKGG